MNWIARRRGSWPLGIPRAVAGIAALVLMVAGLAYGTARADHVAAFLEQFYGARDAVANHFGFRIAAVTLTGQRHVGREEIFATAGVNGRASLLFLDVDAARERLKADPWIADATVIKFYPDRLQITIVEREPFAIWQKDGRIFVVAEDGAVLGPDVGRRFVGLPFVVGRGAAGRAKEFLALIDRYPEIRQHVRASLLVAERRWNLRLRSGVDVRLPETDVAGALERLVVMEHQKKLLSRDIEIIDLRIPDRVTVRLSENAAKARAEAIKEMTRKRKRGDA